MCDDKKQNLATLALIVDNFNVHNIYQGALLWEKRPVSDIEELALDLNASSNATRTSAEGFFYCVSTLSHEIMFSVINSKDGGGSKAVDKLIGDRQKGLEFMLSLVRKRLENAGDVQFVFEWLSRLCLDIISFNKKNVKFETTKTSVFEKTMMNVKCWGCLVKLFNESCHAMFTQNPQIVIGKMILFGSTDFTNTFFVIEKFMRETYQAMQFHLTEHCCVRFHQSFEKGMMSPECVSEFNSVATFLDYYYSQNLISDEYTIAKLVGDTCEGKNIFARSSPAATLVCLIRTIAFSPTLTKKIVPTLFVDLKTEKVVKAYEYFLIVSTKLVSPESYYWDLVGKFVDSLDTRNLFILLDILLKIWTQPKVYLSNVLPSVQSKVTFQGAVFKILSELANTTLQVIYKDAKNCPILKKFDMFMNFYENRCERDKLLIFMVENEKAGQVLVPILQSFCIYDYKDMGMDLMAKGLYLSKNTIELKRFLALVVSVQIVHSDVLVDAIKYTRKKFNQILSDLGDNHTKAQIQMMKNMVQIKNWHDKVKETTNIGYLKLELLEVTCNVITVAFNSASHLLDSIREHFDATALNELINALTGICTEFRPEMLIRINQTYKWNKWMALILSKLLLLIKDVETSASVTTAYDKIFFNFLLVYRSQLPLVRTGLYLSILEEILANSHILFGTTVAYENKYVNVEIDEEVCDVIKQMSLGVQESQTLAALRLNSDLVSRKKVTAMAHSGRLRLPPVKVEQGSSFGCIHRQKVFISYFVNTLNDNESGNKSSELKRDVIKLICEAICDGLVSTTHLAWGEWEFEKNLVDVHIKIGINYKKLCWVQDFIIGVSAKYNYVLWYMSPVFKSLFANILMQMESSIDKNSLLSIDLKRRIDDLFVLLQIAQMLPKGMHLILTIFDHCTIHEGYLIMLDIWKSIAKNVGQVFPSINNPIVEVDMRNFEKKPFQPYFGYLTNNLIWIIQRHMVKLAFLMPELEKHKLVLLNNDDDPKTWTGTDDSKLAYVSVNDFCRVDKRRFN